MYKEETIDGVKVEVGEPIEIGEYDFTYGEITGGTYSKEPDEKAIPAGYMKVQDADGKWRVIPERTLALVASKPSIKAGEAVDITVQYESDADLVYAEWTLDYDAELFECEDDTDAIKGTIDDIKKDTGKYIKKGDKLKTYTFVAKEPIETTTGTFALTFAETQDQDDTHMDRKIVTKTKPVDVTITLNDYEVEVFVDGEKQTEAEKTINYDGKPHTVEVETEPEAQRVDYVVKKLDDLGNVVSEVVLGPGEIPEIVDEGTYEIGYVATPAAGSGYGKKEGSFKLVIDTPVFVVEVDTDIDAHYVEARKIVLVHTDIEALAFTYGEEGSELPMVDVSSRGYWYNDGTKDVRQYKYVFAIVTDALEGGAATLDKYEALVDYKTRDESVVVIPEYDYDLNMSGSVDHSDLSVMYGSYNVREATFAKHAYMAHILKSDINGDKTVDGHDLAKVINAVYPIK